jgi:hypothetical protein
MQARNAAAGAGEITKAPLRQGRLDRRRGGGRLFARDRLLDIPFVSYVVLLKCLLLQQWHRLSDPGLEEALRGAASKLLVRIRLAPLTAFPAGIDLVAPFGVRPRPRGPGPGNAAENCHLLALSGATLCQIRCVNRDPRLNSSQKSS